MNISTISTADIIPEATKAIHKYTKRSDPHVTLFKYDTHVTVDDLVMDTVEKVLKANPKYLTKTYVWLAAKSTCINRSQKRKLDTIPCAPVFSDDSDSTTTPLEEGLPGDTYDILDDLHEYLKEHLGTEENQLLDHLLQGKLYAETAETLGISLRTLERRIHELKWKTEYLLTEVNPDSYSLIF